MKINRKLFACGLCALLAVSCFTLPVCAEASEAQPASGSGSTKDENVFISLRADGSVEKQTVSDWLHCDAGLSGYEDTSSLQQITNLKGTDVPDQEGRRLIWHTDGTDVYYQGSTDATPPVTAAITYTLDGQEMPAEDMIGRNGHVVVTVALTNNAKKQRTIDGKSRTVSTPFVTAVGAALSADSFANVAAPNGTVQTDSNTQLVGFVCLPGMRQNFDGLLTGKFSELQDKFLDSVSFEADVTDFSAPTLVIACASDASLLKNDAELSSFSGVFDDLDALSNATDLLVENAQKLADGTGTVASATGTLASGATSLLSGAAQLQTGAASLSSGLGQLSANNAQLNGGAAQMESGIFTAATTQLQAAGYTGAALDRSNYSAILNGMISGATPTSAQIAQAEALMRQTLASNTPSVTDLLQQSVVLHRAGDMLSSGGAASSVGALTAAGTEVLTVSTLQNNATALLTQYGNQPLSIPAVQAAFTAITASQDASAWQTAYAGFDAQLSGQGVADANSRALFITMMALDVAANGAEPAASLARIVAVASVQQAVATVAQNNGGQVNCTNDASIGTVCTQAAKEAVSSTLSGLLTTLDQTVLFVNSLSAYTGGVATAYAGAQKLADGSGSLYSGLAQMQSGSAQLESGARKLQSSAQQFATATQTYREEGIGQLTDAPEIQNLQGVLDVTDAMRDQAANYTSYTGAPAGISSTVKFVMKTQSVAASDTALAAQTQNSAAVQAPKESFWQRFLDLFDFLKK